MIINAIKYKEILFKSILMDSWYATQRLVASYRFYTNVYITNGSAECGIKECFSVLSSV